MSNETKNFSGYDPEVCGAWVNSWLDPDNQYKDVRTRQLLADAAEQAVNEARRRNG